MFVDGNSSTHLRICVFGPHSPEIHESRPRMRWERGFCLWTIGSSGTYSNSLKLQNCALSGSPSWIVATKAPLLRDYGGARPATSGRRRQMPRGSIAVDSIGRCGSCVDSRLVVQLYPRPINHG